jgi:molybdopterin-biosynthesis enzyme MoeA-like protein
MRSFGAIIIGDEILSGKRVDQHFAKVAELLARVGCACRGSNTSATTRARIAATLRRSLAAGDVVFSFGGIGNTPDDHTRQAAAEALGVDLVLHPDAEREIRARFGDQINDVRLLLGTFPRGVDIIPNPFNRIPGFRVRDHYFVPGFPQMAHPMVEWALETFYAIFSIPWPALRKAFLLTGANSYESALLDLMEEIVADFPTLRLFSLPSISPDGQRRHLELGVEGEHDAGRSGDERRSARRSSGAASTGSGGERTVTRDGTDPDRKTKNPGQSRGFCAADQVRQNLILLLRGQRCCGLGGGAAGRLDIGVDDVGHLLGHLRDVFEGGARSVHHLLHRGAEDVTGDRRGHAGLFDQARSHCGGCCCTALPSPT